MRVALKGLRFAGLCVAAGVLSGIGNTLYEHYLGPLIKAKLPPSEPQDVTPADLPGRPRAGSFS